MNKTKRHTAKPKRGNQHPDASPQLPATIGGKVLEKLTGLGARRLRQLAALGKFPEPKRDRWQTVACIAGVIAHYRSAGDELRAAKLAKLRAETELLEQTFAEREGRLISFDDAVEVGRRGNGAMVSHIMSWTEHPVELREAIILEIRKAGDYFHSQLVAEHKKHETETPENSQALA